MTGICELTLKTLYQNREETGDVTFIVESKPIRAHRLILSTLSEKYKAQFYGPHADQDDIRVEDVTVAAFNEFLRLFYFNEVELSLENIGEVFDLVKESLVDTFLSKCIDFLETTMTFDNKNLCFVYRLINTYDIEPLRKLCEEKISNNAREVFLTKDFFNCDRETLGRILKLDKLSFPERYVFDACIWWAGINCVKKDIDETVPENLRAALGDTITHIRFASMTIEEFTVRQPDGFFTLEESTEICNIIAKVDGFQSQKFNQTPRQLLECNFVGDRLAFAPYIGNEQIHFDCDGSIFLHGFVISSNLVKTVTVDVVWDDVRSVHPRVSIENSANETIITFGEPIHIVRNQRYRLFIDVPDLEGLSFQQHTHQRQVESNETLFTFQNDSNLSLVSRFLFTPK